MRGFRSGAIERLQKDGIHTLVVLGRSCPGALSYYFNRDSQTVKNEITSMHKAGR